MKQNIEDRDSREFKRWAQNAYAPRAEEAQFFMRFEDKWFVDFLEEVDIQDAMSRQRFAEAVEIVVRKILRSI